MSPDGACTVLLADDDHNLCLTLRDILEVNHHIVDLTHSGHEALTASSERDYDVVLLDISLPDLSGLELISKLEEIQPQMDILIITGHASLDSAVQSVSRSTIGYLVKPIDPDRLLSILDGIAQRKRVALENQRLVEGREALIRQLEEKNAELERYTYTVSHDLSSPLVTITGFLGMIGQSAAAGDIEQVRLDIARITGTTHRMKQLLDELLELSRIGRVVHPPKAVPLAKLVRQAVDSLAGPIDQHAVEVVIAQGLPVVRGDSLRLLQVFQNLIDNAIKFMGDQAKPRVEIGFQSQGLQTQGLQTQGFQTQGFQTQGFQTQGFQTQCEAQSGKVFKSQQPGLDERTLAGSPVIWVRDNGIGIEPDHVHEVFGLFKKIDKGTGGSGIGLALVQRIIDFHGGQICVESEGRGRGSCFYLTLPTGERTDGVKE